MTEREGQEKKGPGDYVREEAEKAEGRQGEAASPEAVQEEQETGGALRSREAEEGEGD